MTRSMRVMFLTLIAAMLAAVVTLHAKNGAMETSRLPPAAGGTP